MEGDGESTESKASRDFAVRLGEMYLEWAKRRGMKVQILGHASGTGTEPYRLRLAISGYAAYQILEPENGLHVFEEPDARGHGFRRSKARVRVVPQPPEPAGEGLEPLRVQAGKAFAAQPSEQLTVARRYRAEPSPLVRDTVRGWRTGRLDRVLQGDFDVIRDRQGQQREQSG